MAPRSLDYVVDSQQMVRSIRCRDDLTLVVRGHICLELVLNSLLVDAIPEGLDYLETLSFPAKVDLAVALGQVPMELRNVWLGVNGIRNRFAHDLDAKLEKSAVDALYPIRAPVDSQVRIRRAPSRPGASTHARLAYVIAMLWTHAVNQIMTQGPGTGEVGSPAARLRAAWLAHVDSADQMR